MTGLIILEGPDGSGKSTLAAELARHFGPTTKVVHLSYRWRSKPGEGKPTMFHYHTAAIHRAVQESNQRVVILDRMWPSELIYAKVYRGGTPWPMMGRLIDRVVLKHAGLYVFCLTDPAVAEARHAELSAARAELYRHQAAKVAAEYTLLHQQMARRTDVLQYRIGVEGADMHNFCARVADTLGRWREAQYPGALDPADHNVLGHLRSAEVMFVGDVTNPKLHAINWPFYEHGNCSLFLAETLDKIGFDETTAMWVNANGPNGSKHLKALLELNQKLCPVALGQNAADELHRLGFSFLQVEHPQHARRFNRDSYAHALDGLLNP